MKVIGKEMPLTKLETFIEIKKELNFRKDLNSYLFQKINSTESIGSRMYFEDILLKLNIDKMLQKQIQKYIYSTCRHLITKEMYNASYNESEKILNDISNKVIQLFNAMEMSHIENKEKMQIVDLDCQGIVDIYVILNYIDKKYDDAQIEHILQLAHSMINKED